MTDDFGEFRFEQAPPGPVRLAVGRFTIFHAPPLHPPATQQDLPATPIGSPSASGKETQ